MINLKQIAANLDQSTSGIWLTTTNGSISYPPEGNNQCYQIEDSSFWFKHRNNIISELVLKFSSNKVFFDIGGGNGFVSRELQSRGIETILIEPGGMGVQNAQKRGLKNIIQARFQDINFNPNSLSSIGLFDVIEHVEDDLQLLTDLKNLLQPNGFIYITVPAYNFLWSKEDTFAGHFRRYDAKSLLSLHKKAGLELRYYSYFFSFLIPPIFMFRALPSFFNLQTSLKKKKLENEHVISNQLTNQFLKKSRP